MMTSQWPTRILSFWMLSNLSISCFYDSKKKLLKYYFEIYVHFSYLTLLSGRFSLSMCFHPVLWVLFPPLYVHHIQLYLLKLFNSYFLRLKPETLVIHLFQGTLYSPYLCTGIVCGLLRPIRSWSYHRNHPNLLNYFIECFQVIKMKCNLAFRRQLSHCKTYFPLTSWFI